MYQVSIFYWDGESLGLRGAQPEHIYSGGNVDDATCALVQRFSFCAVQGVVEVLNGCTPQVNHEGVYPLPGDSRLVVFVNEPYVAVQQPASAANEITDMLTDALNAARVADWGATDQWCSAVLAKLAERRPD